jgi:hypothetical protein
MAIIPHLEPNPLMVGNRRGYNYTTLCMDFLILGWTGTPADPSLSGNIYIFVWTDEDLNLQYDTTFVYIADIYNQDSYWEGRAHSESWLNRNLSGIGNHGNQGYFVEVKDDKGYIYTSNNYLEATIELDNNVAALGSSFEYFDNTIYIMDGAGYLKAYNIGGTIAREYDTVFTPPVILSAKHLYVNQPFMAWGDQIYMFNDYEAKKMEIDVLNHIQPSGFLNVKDIRIRSRIEISKQLPTIVYNTASGSASTNLYWSESNASGSFDSIYNFDQVHCMRVYDANYLGEYGSGYAYTRYLGYTIPSGMYTLDTSAIEGTPSQVITTTISGVQPSGEYWMMEVGNLGMRPYMFFATSGPQEFFQRGPTASGYLPSGIYASGVPSEGFVNHSINIPSGFITTIRLDDSL